ncbi:MAG: hypothetical protein IPG72_05790 [Ardenticatenales bacterium]|jgi:hypothetical protein|nr:hypothetical protein [Ardenticatenales bacterium]
MNLRRALSPGTAFGLAVWAMAVRRLAFAHLAVVHEGSPNPTTPRTIDDVTLAQAFYARLDRGARDHYAFRVADDVAGRFILLVPATAYDSGFRADVVLTGPGLPDEGRPLSPAGDSPMTIAGIDYRLAAALSPDLGPGDYRVEVRSTSDADGVYSLCVGDREAGAADPVTRARVRALIGV